VRPGGRLGHRQLAVRGQCGVVVDGAVGGQQAAVPVRGELVQAQVAHHHGGVADLGDHVADGDVEDAVRVRPARAGLVLDGRYAEQHQPADTGPDRLVGGLAQRLPGVLHDARQRADRARLGQPFLDEHGQHQLGGRHPGLRDQAAHRRAATQPPRPHVGIRHQRLLTSADGN
jgi:hypothetical protein